MPTENKTAEPSFDLNTPDGGRGYIANLFKTVLKRHDYRQYINERLAGDFACTLAQYFERITAERDALQMLLNAADQRIDELVRARGLLEPKVTEHAFTEQLIEDHLGKKPERIKGMIEAVGGQFAIMIDQANGHYGWTFKRHPDGMWVSGRKATDVEMHAARTHAHITNQQ